MRCDIYVGGGGVIYFMIKISSVFKLPHVNFVCVWGGGGGWEARGDHLLILLKWLAYEDILSAFWIIPVILFIIF